MRRTELAAAIFFAYATAWAWILPVGTPIRLRMVAVNALVIAAACLAQRWPPSRTVIIVRDWAPAALILLAYKEMGWLAVPQTSFAFENYWVQWDRRLLTDWGLKASIEAGGPLIPGFLEFCYLMVYLVIPAALAAVYWHGEREHIERLTLPLFIACLCTYGLFPFFPSDTPRRVFPDDLVPSFQTVFRQVNWWLCEGAGIHTSVFPSGHVSSGIACAFGLRRAVPQARRTFWLFALLAAGIFLATIYGRYHYAIDSVAGAAVSALALWLTRGMAAGSVTPARPR